MDARDLDRGVRAALRGLEARNAQRVAEHLVVAGTLVDEDPATALEHARAARERASRIAEVREAVGVAAYHAGNYAEAARELRAFRRMSGDHGYLAVLADCERALGRADVALRSVREALAEGPAADEVLELRLVEAGARADLGEHAAARLVLESALGGRPRPATADLADPGVQRVATAYADLLEVTGDPAAEQWRTALEEAAEDEDDGVVFEESGPLPEVAEARTGSGDGPDHEIVEAAPGDAPDVGAAGADVASDDELDLPGITTADIEAEVAELLGEEPPHADSPAR